LRRNGSSERVADRDVRGLIARQRPRRLGRTVQPAELVPRAGCRRGRALAGEWDLFGQRPRKDEPLVLEFLAENMREDDFTVLTAASGGDAMNALALIRSSMTSPPRSREIFLAGTSRRAQPKRPRGIEPTSAQ
jgi:hypothetical protein